MRTRPQKVVGVGELVDMQVYCQLTYERCGHRLDIVRYVDLEGAVRRLHATCLGCQRAAGRGKTSPPE